MNDPAVTVTASSAASGGAVIDETKMAAARLWATNRFPYLATAIFASPAVAAPGLGRVVIDRWWRIHADPSVVESAAVDELGGELLHLTAHVLRDHAGRADEFGFAEAAELHHWGDAADAEIADDFPADVDRITDGAGPTTLDCPDGRLAEEYYRRGSVIEGATTDCGSGAHGLSSTWEPPTPDESDERQGVTEDDQDLIRYRVASDIARSDADAVAAGLRRWADRQLSPTVDWRAELAAALRRSISTVAGAVDYSYARPSRRAATIPDVVMPSLRKPVVEVAVVCDTSASVSDELLAIAVEEVDGLLRAVGTRSVQLLACDDAVQATSRVRQLDDVVLLGGGGTDLTVGIDAALALRPEPQLVVVLTDGYTPWPNERPQHQVVVGLLPTDELIPAPDPPSWATTVEIAPAEA